MLKRIKCVIDFEVADDETLNLALDNLSKALVTWAIFHEAPPRNCKVYNSGFGVNDTTMEAIKSLVVKVPEKEKVLVEEDKKDDGEQKHE